MPVPESTYKGPIDNSINNTQAGADLVNANRDQAAKMGIKIPGSTYTPPPTLYNPDGSVNTQAGAGAAKPPVPTPTPSGTDTSGVDTTDSDKAKADLAAKQKQDDQVNTDTYNKLMGLINGTTPLTAGEEAQVNGLIQQHQQLIEEQRQSNQNVLDAQNLLDWRQGRTQYQPMQHVQDINSTVTKGLQKVQALQIQEAAAVASMTEGFRDHDIKAIQDAWKSYNDVSKDRKAEFQKVIDDTQKAIENAYKQKEDQKKDALDAQKQALDELIHSDTVSYQDKQQAIANAQLSETVRHNKATEAAQAQVDFLSNLPGPVSTSTYGAPNKSQQSAFLDQLPGGANGELAQTIKGLTSYQTSPASLINKPYKGSGVLSRQEVIALAQKYDPNYSEAQYATRAAYQKAITSGQYSQSILAANKTINHLSSLLTGLDALNNINLGGTYLNAPINAVEKPFSGSLQTRLQSVETEKRGVAAEMEKFFKGTGANDVTGIEHWEQGFSPNMSPAMQTGLQQGALTLFTGQLDALYGQYQSTMGTNPPVGKFVTEETLGKLDGMGVDITPYIQGTAMGDVRNIAQTGTPQEQKAIADMINKGMNYDDILTVLGR